MDWKSKIRQLGSYLTLGLVGTSFLEKGSCKCISVAKRFVPQLWGTSNGIFVTDKVGDIEISFVEYSAIKKVHLQPDIVEYSPGDQAPIYDFIIGRGCTGEFSRMYAKKKVPRRQEKRNPRRGQKEQLVPLPKLAISALNDGGQYPPGVIILQCSHCVLPVWQCSGMQHLHACATMLLKLGVPDSTLL